MLAGATNSLGDESWLTKPEVRRNFGADAALPTEILDRHLHRSVLVEFHGKSYRLKEADNILAKGPVSE